MTVRYIEIPFFLIGVNFVCDSFCYDMYKFTLTLKFIKFTVFDVSFPLLPVVCAYIVPRVKVRYDSVPFYKNFSPFISCEIKKFCTDSKNYSSPEIFTNYKEIHRLFESDRIATWTGITVIICSYCTRRS